MKKCIWLLFSCSLLISFAVQAKPGALIDMPGPKPQVAKSWKSLGKGKYQFVIDPSQKMTAADVKESLEKRLKSMKAKVSVSGNKVTVTYEADEKAFLEKVARVKIRKSRGGTKIALESTLADGGIRADKGRRSLAKGEVRAKALANVSGGKLKVMITDISAEAKKLGITKRMTTIYPAKTGKRGDVIYFSPLAKEGKVWKVKSIKNK